MRRAVHQHNTDRPLGLLESGGEPTNADFMNFDHAGNNKHAFSITSHRATSPHFDSYGVVIIH